MNPRRLQCRCKPARAECRSEGKHVDGAPVVEQEPAGNIALTGMGIKSGSILLTYELLTYEPLAAVTNSAAASAADQQVRGPPRSGRRRRTVPALSSAPRLHRSTAALQHLCPCRKRQGKPSRGHLSRCGPAADHGVAVATAGVAKCSGSRRVSAAQIRAAPLNDGGTVSRLCLWCNEPSHDSISEKPLVLR
jgi:hypothetical protein